MVHTKGRPYKTLNNIMTVVIAGEPAPGPWMENGRKQIRDLVTVHETLTKLM